MQISDAARTESIERAYHETGPFGGDSFGIGLVAVHCGAAFKADLRGGENAGRRSWKWQICRRQGLLQPVYILRWKQSPRRLYSRIRCTRERRQTGKGRYG